MKLISMHVDDFGGLHNYDYNFEEGLNVVLHDNGWGKTTMASFLKAMLYGFDSKRSKDITENERKRYLPWQGGTYGGSLDFEADGVHYRIYRTFGETPRFDKAKIVNVDKKTTAKIDPEKIGETLFRLDASAFQRSVFINQNGLSIDGAASSIHTRLNALVSQANDVAAYDEAIAKLTAQIKIFEKTGARGQIGDISRQISALERQRDQLEADIAAQDEARARIAQIDILLSSIDEDREKKKKRLDEVSGEAKKREASKKLLEDINKQIADLQAQIDAVKTDLGGKVPTQSEIDTVKRQKQAVATLSAQLSELEASHAKLTADYTALLEKYNDTLPTTAQLDEIQSIYGELQGILSTGNEEVSASETAPEGYDVIKVAVDRDAEFIDRLKITVGSQMTIQQLIRKLESQDRDIRMETESWGEKKKRYTALAADVERLQSEVDAQKQYAPAVVDPVISGLDDLQKKSRKLSQQKVDQEAAIKREGSSWDEKKKRFTALQAEVDSLSPEVEGAADYSSEKVGPVIKKLEEIQRKQQLVEVKSDSLAMASLTTEQEAFLASNTGDLPDANDGSNILKKFRNVAAQQAEIQGLSARLDGERSRADSIKASIDQLGAAAGMDAAKVEEPKKPAGGAMIGAGAAVAVIGAILIFVVTPIMAIVAAVGAILAVLGVVNNNSYKAKLQAYEAYKATETKRQETNKKKAELQSQLDSVLASVTSLEQKVADCKSQIEADEAEVSEWMRKWAPGVAPSENAISQIIDNAEEVKKLRKKKQEASELQTQIEEQRSSITADRASVDALYPVLAGKTVAEALSQLRSAETDYKIKADKLKTAKRNLEKFIAEAKISEDQFAAEESPLIAELQSQLKQIESELESIEAARKAYDEQYPEIMGLSYDDALSSLRGKQSAYRVSDGQLQTAITAEQKFVSEAKVSREQLALSDSPRIAEMTEARNATADTLNQALLDANEVLSAIGVVITAETAQAELRKAEQMLNVYKQQADKLKGRAERQQKKQQQVENLQRKLEEKLPALQGRYAELDMPERLALIRENVTDAAKLREKVAEAEADQSRQTAKLSEASEAVEAFISAFTHFEHGTEDVLTEIFAKAGSYAELLAATQQLEKQRAAIGQEQGNASHQASDEENELKAQIVNLEARRDALLVEYTQKGDFIRQADLSLEKYPDVTTEIRQLYDQKQKAMNTLVMLKRTIQLITKAKENLANRYLSKVEQLFNNYMHIWLNNDAVRGILDIDFNITIEENDKVHVAEGYSTGYCDLIDFCMRLALVDTLFESEQPFLILDDPFVNLDVDRLDKALELLNVMAANKQIVYFVCHPIRAVEADENSASRAEFVRIAEATRRTIEDRRSSGTEVKKIVRKSPKELYKVVDGAALAFRPAKPNYTITNNIFGMNFVMNDLGMPKDNSYELFFIDAKGHVLNERQLLEIKGGKLSTERVQFCLNTRDDSGDQYELMIRESGQDDYEVVARLPFKAKLAFAGTDSFDF